MTSKSTTRPFDSARTGGERRSTIAAGFRNARHAVYVDKIVLAARKAVVTPFDFESESPIQIDSSVIVADYQKFDPTLLGHRIGHSEDTSHQQAADSSAVEFINGQRATANPTCPRFSRPEKIPAYPMTAVSHV